MARPAPLDPASARDRELLLALAGLTTKVLGQPVETERFAPNRLKYMARYTLSTSRIVRSDKYPPIFRSLKLHLTREAVAGAVAPVGEVDGRK
jgi:hypothetical protein